MPDTPDFIDVVAANAARRKFESSRSSSPGLSATVLSVDDDNARDHGGIAALDGHRAFIDLGRQIFPAADDRSRCVADRRTVDEPVPMPAVLNLLMLGRRWYRLLLMKAMARSPIIESTSTPGRRRQSAGIHVVSGEPVIP